VKRGSVMPTLHLIPRPPGPPRHACALGVVLVSGLVGGLLGCSADAPPAEPELRPVRFEVVSSVEAGRRRSFSGTCQPAVEPRLSFKVDGTIARRPVNMGDRVKRGALIAELDPSDFQLQVEEAAAALRSAEAESRNAQAGFDRIRGLYENGNASRTDFDGARAAAESGRAYVESIGKRAELARQQLSYTRLVAPVAGAVAEVSAEVNENVRAGQEVVRLAAEEGYEVVVTVPESLIGQIRHGQDVRVTFDALPGHTFGATVTEVSVTTSSTGTAFPVKARLDDDDPGVRPGMAAELEFRLEAPGEGAHFRVPPHAVSEDRAGRFVFIVEPSDTGRGVVRRREVKVGSLTPDGIEVQDGLGEGDRLVTAGISQLEDGDTVKLAAGG
jgi:multidrug efflux system membrane fusion protein